MVAQSLYFRSDVFAIVLPRPVHSKLRIFSGIAQGPMICKVAKYHLHYCLFLLWLFNFLFHTEDFQKNIHSGVFYNQEQGIILTIKIHFCSSIILYKTFSGKHVLVPLKNRSLCRNVQP